MRIVVMASESLTVREVELFRRHFPVGSHLVNQVGTSESYNYRLYAVDHQIPIENVHVAGGYAVSEDRQVVILDDKHRELPPGSTGEIGVKSDYMSAGYWGDETLTRSKFLHVDSDPVPVYLTGDLGTLEPDDCLIHLGRIDFQVKIRGYRVELAEVDHVLAAAPGVADCAAWVVKNRLGDDQLVGYVVPKSPGMLNQQEVEKYLESRLPDYMVPRHYVILESFPTLPTGKVDRKGLPNPFDQVERGAESTVTRPASLEQKIISLFRELLQIEHVGPQSHFFQLGGDSLLTALLMHHVYQGFGVEINFDDFADSPTPARMANLIQAATNGPRGI
jgi:acyl-coenzyme A synthetase/AMP-(fatty) acid ligase/acyl carrier protein